MEEIIYNFLAYAFERFPNLSAILLVIGVLRAVNKPLLAFLRSYVLATPGTADDQILDSVEQSKLYKGISFFLDWTASIKLPVKHAIPELPKGNDPVEK